MDVIEQLRLIDEELYRLVAQDPALAKIHEDLLDGEKLGDEIILPRMPTEADWAAAEALVASRAG